MMEIRERHDAAARVVALVGRLDSNSARDAETTILPLFEAGRPLVVDFSELVYISSAGLRVLLMAAKRSKATGVKLSLSGMNPHVLEVFQISGFSKLFSIHPSLDGAVAAVSA